MSRASRCKRLDDLPVEWRSTARLFREHEQAATAVAYEKCAETLEEVLSREREAPLTLPEAAAESGYSADHLGRLVRQGKIPNAGRPGAPRIARGDLPIRAQTPPLPMAEEPGSCHNSFEQIVQSVIDEGVA